MPRSHAAPSVDELLTKLREFVARETSKPPASPARAVPNTDLHATPVAATPPPTSKLAAAKASVAPAAPLPPPSPAPEERVGTTVYMTPPLTDYQEPDFAAEAISTLPPEEQPQPVAVPPARTAPAMRMPPTLPPPPALSTPSLAPSRSASNLLASAPPPPLSVTPPASAAGPPAAPSPTTAPPSFETVMLTRQQQSATVYFQIPPVGLTNPASITPVLDHTPAAPPQPLSSSSALSSSSTSSRSSLDASRGTVVYTTPPVSDSDGDRGTVMFSSPPSLAAEAGESLSSLLESLSTDPTMTNAAPAADAPHPPPRIEVGKARSGAVVQDQHTSLPPTPMEPSDPQFGLYQRLKQELQSEMMLNQEIMREEMRLEVEMRLAEFLKLMYQEIATRERRNKQLEAEIATLKARLDGR